jgi:pimeloyl-ACP methyl ester carboxylesterase
MAPYVIAVVIGVLAVLLLYWLASGPKLPPETDRVIDRVLFRELPKLTTGQTGYATSAGLKIWYECISPAGPAKGSVLLVMAQGGDAFMWPLSFVRAFAEAGYRVIRYDHRGTGLSDWVEAWDRKQPYILADMARDAAAVLDALQIDTAHVVGLSMGGMIAQELAARFPERVASLTLMMTSGYIGDPDRPGLTTRYFLSALVTGLPLLRYRLAGGERNLIKERIAKMALQVPGAELDLQELAEMVLYDLRKRRGINVRAAYQHHAAITIAGSRYEKLQSLDVPALIIHGTADPLIPIEHGKKLAALIPNARVLWLDGAGHGFPLPNMRAVTQQIIWHLDTCPQ